MHQPRPDRHPPRTAVQCRTRGRHFHAAWSPPGAGKKLIWKAQVPYFSRSGFKVVTFDNRGNGKADRLDIGYSVRTIAEDALAVMAATGLERAALGLERAALVSFSIGGSWAVRIAAEHPERVSHLVLISTGMGAGRSRAAFHEPYDGKDKNRADYWRRDYPGFLQWWAERIVPEPHSTKQREDIVNWGLGTTPDILIKTIEERNFDSSQYLSRITCRTLILNGSEDQGFTPEAAEALQEAIPGAQRHQLEGSGHTLLARDPVKTNLLLHEFLGPARPPGSPGETNEDFLRRALAGAIGAQESKDLTGRDLEVNAARAGSVRPG